MTRPNPETVLKIALGPLLLMQGRYARWVTPKLPEAAGDREGEQGSGPQLRLLVVGDSAAAGVGVTNQSDALTGRLVQTLAAHYRIRWKLLAQTGLRADEVRALIAAEPPQPFDVVVISVGVNDITQGRSVRQWSNSMQQLLGLVADKYAGPRVLVTGVPPMQHFRALPQPLRWYLGRHSDRFNQHLELLLPHQPNCTFLRPDFPPAGEYLARDGFHPGAPAYQRWAEVAASIIHPELDTGQTPCTTPARPL